MSSFGSLDSRPDVGRLNPEIDDWARERAGDITARKVEWDRAYAAQQGHRPDADSSAMWFEDQVQLALTEMIRSRLNGSLPPISSDVEDEFAEALRTQLSPTKVLGKLLEDPDIENISVNGPRVVWITYAGGRKVRGPAVARSDDELGELVRFYGRRFGRSEKSFDASNPTIDIQLPDGSRFHAIMGVTSEVTISVRKHRFVDVSLDGLVRVGTITPDIASFLRTAIQRPNPANMLIAGATDAGKTTFLRALVNEIDYGERLVTAEEVRELKFADDPRREDVVEMETRDANAEGQGAIDLRDLLKEALRMRPDRIFVGEVRGPEIVEMLNAMSVGNDGSLCTIHSEDAYGALGKATTYGWQGDMPAQATSRLLAQSVHLVVHIRKGSGGRRFVSQIVELNGSLADSGEPQTLELWKPGPDGRAVRTNTPPSERLKARLNGLRIST